MIEIKNLDFAYKADNVLKNISTDIKKGEFVGIVGPNGSGKSTLIKTMAGILPVHKYSVFINERDIHSYNHNELARNIAYVPQSEQFYPVKVFDAVLMGRKPYIGWAPTKKDHSVVIRVLKMLELEDIALSFLNELSGGQQQRVFIARALAQEAGILLMDEPTANLDLRHALDVLQLLKNLSDTGITVVIAIHDLNFAVRYCNRIMMLNNGTIFSQGGSEIMTSENIKKLYKTNVKVFQQDSHVFFIPE
ncbi:MAG: ABC transporter ATP-binding protein [Bacteroidales bacterium]|nr:ABC transporter ATP-binding protein [Bacteroidales bacterium]